MRLLALAAVALTISLCPAQDRLKTMPGYARYQEVGKKIQGSLKSGSISVQWPEDGKTLEYKQGGKSWILDLATLKASEAPEAKPDAEPDRPRNGARRGTGGGGGPARGRQFSTALSPDGKLKAFCRDRNLWISDAEGENEYAGHDRRQREDAHQERRRELGLRRGARPDHRDVVVAGQQEDRLLPLRREPGAGLLPGIDQTKLQEQARRRGVPQGRRAEPGRRSARLRRGRQEDARSSTSATASRSSDDVVGHYVYHVSWSPDGKELLFNRTNRRQNVMEFVRRRSRRPASAA